MNIISESWFTTLELPHATALLVQADKETKYVAITERQVSGNYIVKYRGLTAEEKKERKEQLKAAKPKGRSRG